MLLIPPVHQRKFVLGYGAWASLVSALFLCQYQRRFAPQQRADPDSLPF